MKQGLRQLVGAALLIIAQGPIGRLALFLIDAQPDVTAVARDYFHTRIWAAPAVLLNFVIVGWFIGLQNGRAPLLIMLVINLINIALDILFVVYWDMNARGVAAAMFRHRRFQRRVHRRQGLLSLSREEPIREPFTLRLLSREGLMRPDGVPTEDGRAQVAKIARDERRWIVARQVHQDAGLTGHHDGLTPIEEVFMADEIREFDHRLGPSVVVGGTA